MKNRLSSLLRIKKIAIILGVILLVLVFLFGVGYWYWQDELKQSQIWMRYAR